MQAPMFVGPAVFLFSMSPTDATNLSMARRFPQAARCIAFIQSRAVVSIGFVPVLVVSSDSSAPLAGVISAVQFSAGFLHETSVAEGVQAIEYLPVARVMRSRTVAARTIAGSTTASAASAVSARPVRRGAARRGTRIARQYAQRVCGVGPLEVLVAAFRPR